VQGEIPLSDFSNHNFESATMQSTISPSTVKSELADITAVAELPDHRTLELDSHPVRYNVRWSGSKREDSW
jgi:hypothetical protein